MKKLSFLLLTLSLLWNCSTPKQYSAIILPETEYRQLDTLVISAPRPGGSETEPLGPESYSLPRYNPSPKREHDLLHTKLDLRFNWEKEQVLGKATLTLKPYFYPTDRVLLDAKGFDFHKVTFEGSNEPLKYDYDGDHITIHLGRKYTRKEQYKLYIEYTATPSESGGSAAITSNKGLFFINPRGEDASKPQQIWTQGETENNSRWFPTIDKPNERATNEIYVTVEDRFKTLSNGVLVSSKKNNDGTRTDHWKMDLPHAPYLVMLAIGEYAIVSDTWNGIPVDYYVEPKFEKYARNIFPHTPEMLQFFSDKTGVPYPWQKYAQVVVRDYVSGAMENTTAVIFGEFMNGTDRELVDNLRNETIVAHEMFHHWFGDYVTCESWANLTLNEGFANYSEYLWLEHKYGREEADLHRLQEQSGYLQSAAQGIRPIIHFGYEDKEDMFDAHSYNKGGLVLHMLRYYVGDEAFFAAIEKYLKDNAFSDVEGHELRLAFEDVTGEDFNWFFNQWFYREGHPQLTVEYDYDEATRQVIVSVEQTQDPQAMPPIFELPVSIDIYVGGKKTRHLARIDQRQQTFTFDAAQDPDLIVFDAEGVLLAEVEEEKSMDEYLYQFENAGNFLHRIKALGKIMDSEDSRSNMVMKKALQDKFWLFRLFAADNADMEDADLSARIVALAEKDPHSDVRLTAVEKLGETGDKKHVPLLLRIIENDKAIKVVSAALNVLLELDEEAALKTTGKLEKENSEGIILALAGVYAKAGDPAKLRYFEEKFNEVGGYSQYSFLQHYAALAANADPAGMLNAANRMKGIALDGSKFFWMRYLATKSINDLHAALSERIESETDSARKSEMEKKDNELIAIIEAIKAWETDVRVRNMYANFPDPPNKP